MADDTAAVIRHLDLTKCNAFGYSDGGNVALGLVIRHPELVERIAICGTNANNDGLDPRMLWFEGGCNLDAITVEDVALPVLSATAR